MTKGVRGCSVELPPGVVPHLLKSILSDEDTFDKYTEVEEPHSKSRRDCYIPVNTINV